MSCSTTPSPDRAGPLVLLDVTLIDGTGAEPRSHQVVVIEGEQITGVFPVAEFEASGDSTILELAGRYVVPGFVDLHVHFPSDPAVQEAILARLLEFGVTTILNPGARPGAGVALRERVRRGEVDGPRIVTAGRIIEHAPAEPGLAGWAAEVTTVDQMRAEVRAQAKQGVDCIKLYRHLPSELVRAGIDEAHALGLPVIGHMGATTWGEAAAAGIDMLVHSGWGTPMDEVISLDDPDGASDSDWYRAFADAARGARLAELSATLVAEAVIVVPTVSITQASGLGRDATLLPLFRTELAPEAKISGWWDDGWRERHPQYRPDSEEEAEMMATVYMPGVLAILRAHHLAGVRLGVGTDVGNSWMTPGFVFHHELQLYRQAGIPPLEILTMATRNGAEAVGLIDETGTLEAGKRADLVVLSADPSEDIANTRRIESVFVGGRRVGASSPRP